MNLKTNLNEALNSLLGAKQRSLLALIGIVVGIGSVIAMVSTGTIVQNEALRQFMEMGTDIMTVSKQFGRGEGFRERPGGLTIAHAEEMLKFCPSVGAVAPYGSSYGKLKYGGKRFDAPVLGVTQDFMALNKLKLLQGRFLHELDRDMFYCVAGHQMIQKLRGLGVRELTGTKIYVNEKQFIVIGTIAEAPMGGMRPYEINEGVMVPFTALKRVDPNIEVNSIMARKRPNYAAAEASRQIKTYFKNNASGIGVDVRSAEELIQQMQKQMQLYTLLLGAIGSISLIVGGVGVMNVMLVSVSERKKEIGIRRALGAKQGDIQGQFLVESILLCMVGGLLGIGLGVGASYLMAHFSGWQFMVAYKAVVLGVVVAVTVGVFFGYYPARQAARMSPITALRTE